MRKVAIALAFLFLALFVNLNFVQVVQGDHYRDDSRNQRVILNEYSSPRGAIAVNSSTGSVNVAESKATSDELKYLRVYHDGPEFAPATGYNSYVYGPSAIEDYENSILSGDSSKLFTTKLANILTGRNPRGGSVQLTLNKAAQNAAYQGMKSSNGTYRRGAVVALDPSTGAILAMVSTPSYDPNELASHNANTIVRAWNCYSALSFPRQRAGESTAAYNARVNQSTDAQIATRERDCKGLPEDPTSAYKHDPQADSPLLNKAIAQIYPPGSIFKIIDSAAALQPPANLSPETSVPAPNSFWPLQQKKTAACPKALNAACVENFQGETCDNGKTATLAFAFAKSCNTAFADLAVNKLGASQLITQARKFGLDRTPPGIPMSVAESTIGAPAELYSDPSALAQTSFGQRSARVSPLQAAMLSAAVANNGTLMKPYLVQSELRPNLSVLDRTQPKQLSQVIDPTSDQKLIQMMKGVVTSAEGTGHAAAINQFGPNVVVGGKTGTADVGVTSASKQAPDAWFTGFALVKGNPKIAVAVLLETGGVAGDEAAATGGLAAAPVAKKVMAAYLRSIGTGG
jgi:peptidoglycan glycosyltransferase